VLRNLLLLRQLARPMRFKLMVNAVIQPGRVQDARDVLDWANDVGIGFCPVPVNIGPRVDGALHRDPEYAALVECILARKRAGYAISGSLRMNRRSAPEPCRNTLKTDHDGHSLLPRQRDRSIGYGFSDVEALWGMPAALTTFYIRPIMAQLQWAQNHDRHLGWAIIRQPARRQLQ
jgi:hypothetical protein